ncbi:glycoside hydrolase domain-containing protein [Evansella sp. AB-rgal1]|uniref:glycoside hydrolase domain-containing protein n=1 Tax=Evansella sp. AB-rgal1 TaxID=3242696 RepID=UPI00359D5F33
MKLTVKKLVPFFTAFMLFLFTATTFYIMGSEDKKSPVTAKNQDTIENEEGSHDNGDDNSFNNGLIENSITNEINGSGNITNTITNEINNENGEIDNSISNSIDSENGDIENTIENIINGSNGNINNEIENVIKNSSNNNILNNITNNIDVSVDVNVTNNVTNDVKGENGNETGNGNDNGNGEDTNGNGDNGSSNGNGEADVELNPVWGIDSASLTTEDFLACVRNNFGDPQVWGRYLGDKEGVSFGLTQEEVELFHENDIQILVIWNQFTDATGYDKGQSEAEAAINLARDFGIPEGVALFANVEPIYPIDTEFLLGWYDALQNSEYEAGVYGIFDPDRELYVAFEAAAEENPEILDDYYVWTSSPNVGITTEANAPDYNPQAPEGATIAGWQYGIDAETCNIDTNWFSNLAFDIFW